MYILEEIMEISIYFGVKKIQKFILVKLILGFIGGVMIFLGYLVYVWVFVFILEFMVSLISLVGVLVFFIGLLVIFFGGGELIIGNMMVVVIVFMDKKVIFLQLVKNWLVIIFVNIIGVIFVVYFFGYFVGLIYLGVYFD